MKGCVIAYVSRCAMIMIRARPLAIFFSQMVWRRAPPFWGRLGLRPPGPFSSANGREQDEEVKKGSDHQAVHATAYVLAYSL